MLFLFYVVYSQYLVTPPRDFYEKIAMVNIFILRRGRNTYKSEATERSATSPSGHRGYMISTAPAEGEKPSE